MEFMSLFNSLSEGNANRFFQSNPWQHRGVVCFFFLFMELFCGHTAFGQTQEKTSRWTLVRDGVISVYSDAGPQAAVRTLERVRTMAELFREFGRPPVQRPVRIVVFRNSSEFEQYRPSPVSVGFFQSGAEGDWIAFPSSAADRVLLHEFTHLLLHRVTGPLPQWLEEGLAEFFSTTRIQGGFAEFGLPIPEHQRNLQLFHYLRAAELTAASKTGIHYQDAYQANRFYATSWMLVHMLYSVPRYAAGMPAFVQAIDRLTTGSPTMPEVFQTSFGVTMDDALAEARERAVHPTLGDGPRRRIEIGKLALAAASAPETLSIAAIANLQAELFLDCGKPGAAAAKYGIVLRNTSSPASRATAEGYLALAKGANPEALANFEAAIAAGTQDARTVLEYAMLLRDQKGASSRETVTRLLEKAVTMDPNFAEALFLLGARASDRRDFPQAVSYLQKAVGLMPRQSPFWHALAFAQAKSGRLDAARLSANRALRAAETPEHEEMALRLLDMEGMTPPKEVRGGPDVITGAAWQNRKGDANLSGVLHELSCVTPTGPPQLIVRTPSGALEAFSLANPGQIRIAGADGPSIEWNCGKMPARKVDLEYFRSSRELVELRFLP